jgi:hypothetical protein
LKWTGFDVSTPCDSSPRPTCVVLMKYDSKLRRCKPGRIETIDGTDGKRAKSTSSTDLGCYW